VGRDIEDIGKGLVKDIEDLGLRGGRRGRGGELHSLRLQPQPRETCCTVNVFLHSRCNLPSETSW